MAEGLTQLETSPRIRRGRHAARGRQRPRRDLGAQAPPPDARAIILAGDVFTAVNAVKLSAVDYLSKPVDADDVVAALLALDGRKAEPPRIRCRLTACGGSTSAHLRIVRPQRLGDGAPAQYASAHLAAHPGQTRPEVIRHCSGLGARAFSVGGIA
jgi:DNA-binding response OmpR family regulator